MSDLSPFELTETQLRQTFDEEISPDLFRRTTPGGQPVLILLGGQPGAGKTRATEEVLREYSQTVTEIVGDDLRAYHPAYRQLLRESPALMPDATAQASGAWVRMAIDHALEHRHSIIVEGTFRRPELTLGEAHRFHEAGFSTHLVALAVPAPVSRLSTFQRYVDGVRESGQARWTPLKAHEAGFEGTPHTVADAEQSPDVDRISVYARSGAAIFDQRRATGPVEGAASAVEIGRLAPMGGATALVWLRDFHNDIAYLRERAGIEPNMLPLLRQLAVDANTVIDAAHPDKPSRGHRDAVRMLSTERLAQDSQYRAIRHTQHPGLGVDQSATGPVVAPPDTNNGAEYGR